MFLFAHLEPIYQDRAWVRCDGDDIGTEVVSKLRQTYKSVPEDRFATFRHGQFELYYPKSFEAETAQVLAISDEQERRRAKRELLDRVRDWLDSDEDRGRTALLESAGELISDLRSMEQSLSESRAARSSVRSA